MIELGTIIFISILIGMSLIGMMCGILIGWLAARNYPIGINSTLKSLGILASALFLAACGTWSGVAGNWGIPHLLLSIPAYIVCVILILIWVNGGNRVRQTEDQ